VCEGTQTEPAYFRHFNGWHRIVKVAGQKGGFSNLLKKALELKEKYIAGLENEKSCSVWCVMDVDVDYSTPNSESARNQQLKDALKLSQENDIRIALSNPCFELWFLLHFTFTTAQMRGYSAVKQKIAQIPELHGYEKSSDIFEKIVDKLATATYNAKKLKKYHEDAGKSCFDVAANPYTNVWELINAIQNFDAAVQ
jgi:hypothetical protein